MIYKLVEPAGKKDAIVPVFTPSLIEGLFTVFNNPDEFNSESVSGCEL